MKKISIIGANSYIARNLLAVLEMQKEEYLITLYDIQKQHRDVKENYFPINLLSMESVLKVDFDCDIIFIFAGKTGTIAGFDEYETFININEIGLLNLLNAYKVKKATARIVFPSSRLVYKGSDVPISEDGTKEFKTIYAINKFSCEQYLYQYNLLYGMEYSVFRICVPYGNLLKNSPSYGTLKFMLDNAKAGKNIILFGDGKLRRTFTHIVDVCQIMLWGSILPECANDIFNIGGEDLSMYEVAQIIADRYGVEVEFAEWPRESLLIESGSTIFDSRKIDLKLKYKYTEKLANWAASL